MTIKITPEDILTNVNDNNSGAVLISDEVYKRERPSTITDKMEEEVDQYRVEYVAAVIKASGETAINKLFTDNPECDKVVGKANMGASDGRVQTTTYREARIDDGSDAGVNIHGSTMVAVFTPYQSVDGPIKSALDRLTEQAELNEKARVAKEAETNK